MSAIRREGQLYKPNKEMKHRRSSLSYAWLGTGAAGSRSEAHVGVLRATSRNGRGTALIYSYTQLSQYLACPCKYRYRYIDGWQEKESRAGLVFGRAFEEALGAYFRGQDPIEALFRSWGSWRHVNLDYAQRDSWARMYQQGVSLLNLFAQQARVQIAAPEQNLQRRFVKLLSPTTQFVGYVDAVASLDGRRCVIDWKTTAARYPSDPEQLLALDPQLACYSWLAEEAEVAFVVFVRRQRNPEIQYLRSTISSARRREYAQLVASPIAQIEAGAFPRKSGIRFPHNICTSCPFIGLCLDDAALIDKKLVQQRGGAALFDEFDC